MSMKCVVTTMATLVKFPVSASKVAALSGKSVLHASKLPTF